MMNGVTTPPSHFELMAPDLPITCLDYLDSVAACTFQEETEREKCLGFARSRSVLMVTQNDFESPTWSVHFWMP